jgi:hypothetical protein
MRDMKYWQKIMEADYGEDPPDEQEALEDADAAEPLLEVVYPYSLTEHMVQVYADPAYNRNYSVDIYREILVKLLRSVKYWRLDTPRWLPTRLRSLGAL